MTMGNFFGCLRPQPDQAVSRNASYELNESPPAYTGTLTNINSQTDVSNQTRASGSTADLRNAPEQAHIFDVDKNGDTELILAASQGTNETLQYILENNGFISKNDKEDAFNLICLDHKVLLGNDFSKIKTLIKAGVCGDFLQRNSHCTALEHLLLFIDYYNGLNYNDKYHSSHKRDARIRINTSNFFIETVINLLHNGALLRSTNDSAGSSSTNNSNVSIARIALLAVNATQKKCTKEKGNKLLQVCLQHPNFDPTSRDKNGRTLKMYVSTLRDLNLLRMVDTAIKSKASSSSQQDTSFNGEK